MQTTKILPVESAHAPADFTGLKLIIPETDAQACMNLIISSGRLSNAMQLVEPLLKADNAVEMLNVLKQVKLPMTPVV